MPGGLLTFIHEAIGRCLESLGSGWPEASMRARVCRPLLSAASAHTALPRLFPGHSASSENPAFVLCLQGEPLGFLGKNILTTLLVWPAESSPTRHPNDFC